MCTGIQIITKENTHYQARTQEFDIELPYALAQLPKGYEASGYTKWTTQYSVMGVGGEKIPELPVDLIVDGVNEKGLSGQSLYFGDYNVYASKEKIAELGKAPVYAEEFVFWALANAASVADLKEQIKKVAIVDEGLLNPEMGLPQHFMFFDTKGESIVVEPSIEGDFKIFDNPIGIMTNSPTFDWHLTNLRNYTAIQQASSPSIQMGDLAVASIGKGSGLREMPGDFTATGRFIRAAYMKQLIGEFHEETAINTLFHMESSFDIPRNMVKTDLGYQYNQYTVVYDLDKLEMHIRMYDDLNIQSLAFNQEVATGAAPVYKALSRKQTYNYL